MKSQSPFLDVTSFEAEEPSQERAVAFVPTGSPFLTLYEAEEGGGFVDPEADEYAYFLNELYDEEFHEGLLNLVNEATAIYETQFQDEAGDPQTSGYQAERMLTRHFAPLATESDALFEVMGKEFDQRDPNTLSEDEIDAIVDRIQPMSQLTPSFEDFWGKLKKIAKSVAKGAVSVAKKGVKLAAKFSPIAIALRKIKPIAKLLLKRVIQSAIGRLPPTLQPYAQKLAQRLPFLKEFEEDQEQPSESAEECQICRIQNEFNEQIANLLFAPSEVEQDLEVARALNEQAAPDTYPLAELDQARARFVENLMNLKEGEDPTPHIESFLPALLPVLRLGIRLAGRKRVVNFVARLIGKLIGRFVGPKYTPPLSRAIVDAGLRLINLETAPEDTSRAAAEVVSSTVEETMRRVAALPEYMLDDEQLLAGFTQEAFEQASAANLPAALREEFYRRRPELSEGRKFRGIWRMMPRGQRRRYRKFSRRIPIRITPYRLRGLRAFEALSMQEFLEEELGVEPGEEVEAFVHLYEAMPGTQLQGIARHETETPGLNVSDGHKLLHPLTPEAADQLLGAPEMGRDFDTESAAEGHTPAVGQRYYYLEIPGKQPLRVAGMAGGARIRRPTRFKLILDFPKNEIRVRLFLSEVRTQEIAVKLRTRAHTGALLARLGNIVQSGLRRAFGGARGRIKIVHEAMTPELWSGALRRLPSNVPQHLMGRLQEWILKALNEQLKQQSELFIKAAEDTADGVTLMITLSNPPGFPQLRQAMKGRGFALSTLRLGDGAPVPSVKVTAGFTNE